MKMLLLCVVLVLSSCDQEHLESIPVEFEFSLLTGQGVPSTAFNPGENFIFSFQILNKSSEQIWLESFDAEDFFRVHRLDNQEGASNLDLGKPYKSVFCEFISGHYVEPGQALKIERPWIMADSIKNDFKPYFDNSIVCGLEEREPLSRGHYRTGFKSKFTFRTDDRTFSTAQKEFEIMFSIE